MFARTDRLILRPYWPEDSVAVSRLLDQPDLKDGFGEADVAGRDAMFCVETNRRMPRCLGFMRTRKAPRLIGACGIRQRNDRGPELSFCVDRELWGLGLATEMARAVVRIGRATGLAPIEAVHFTDNQAAGRVLRKLGFEATARVEQRYSAARGGDAPVAVYVDAGPRTGGDAGSASELYPDSGLVAA